jgi:isopentenyl-diphosphate Delta-isomerase
MTPDLIPAWVEGRLTPVEKLAVHLQGLRHKAVSVFVLAGDRVLLQQRALTKYHTPGLWANSCCTHPHWDEPPEACASRRLHQELGLSGLALSHAGQVEYRAEVGRGMVEHELVDVFVARLPQPVDPRPDPAEVAATRWMTLPVLQADLAAQPALYTPWLHVYLTDHPGLLT